MKLAGLFHGRPRLQVSALLAGPVGWLVIGYLGSLAVLLITSFWMLDELSGLIEQTWTLQNFDDLLTNDVYRDVTLRTVGVALAVTVTDVLLAFPLAFYMAKVASPRVRGDACRRGADAAVVGLPRQGLRLARDPQQRGGPRTGCSTRSGSRAPATGSSPSGSS